MVIRQGDATYDESLPTMKDKLRFATADTMGGGVVHPTDEEAVTLCSSEYTGARWDDAPTVMSPRSEALLLAAMQDPNATPTGIVALAHRLGMADCWLSAKHIGWSVGWNDCLFVRRQLAKRLTHEEVELLTPHQERICGLVSTGAHDAQIAEIIGRTVQAVRWHLQQAADTLGTSRKELRARLRAKSE